MPSKKKKAHDQLKRADERWREEGEREERKRSVKGIFFGKLGL